MHKLFLKTFILLNFFAFIFAVVNSSTSSTSNYSISAASAKCPKKCYCYRKTVRCMKLDLEKMYKVSERTVFLDFRFNRIRSIPQGYFKGHNFLNTILLNNNLIAGIFNGTFENLFNLQDLYLYKNRINFIESGAFQHMARLERLYLQSNDLHEFDAATFSNLPLLNLLYLYNNHINTIPKKAFENLPKLRRLRLDHNSLRCDCKIAWFKKMLNKTEGLLATANCAEPTEMYGKKITEMEFKQFHCEPPKIVKNPDDIQITLGGTAIFKCSVQSDEEPSIVWMKEEKELIPDNKKYKIMQEEGILMIENAEEQDGGFYECLAKNPEGVVRSRKARMTLNTINFQQQNEEESQNSFYGAPKLIIMPESVQITPGNEEIRLNCRATGNPIPTISWSYNGRILPVNSHFRQLPSGDLLIFNPGNADHGTYRCEAANYIGKISAEATLFVKLAPIFTYESSNVESFVGSSVRLECRASGHPKPEISWFKDIIEILPTDERVFYNADRTVLEIKNAQESDTGTYICEARNEIGTREISIAVKIQKSDKKLPKLIYKPYNIEALIGSTIELPCRASGNPNPGITWQKDGAKMQRTGRFKIGLTGNLYIYQVAPEDQGRYECSAQNIHGRDAASGYISVKNDRNLPTGNILSRGDKFIKIAFAEASREIDAAINNTVESFLHSKNPSSAELFRIIRYPNAPARELAKAAEVYERTLSNIRKYLKNERRVQMNTTTTNSKSFDYHEVLTEEKLDLIAKLSGCTSHRLTINCSDMCFHAKYRSLDGRCNNLQHPTWGSSLTPFRRILPPIYEDGFAQPVGWDPKKLYHGFRKPSSRKLSTSLISTKKITSDEEITHMVMQWGQFLDHDLDHALPSVSSESWDGIDCKKSCNYAAPCYPMDVPEDDPRIKNRRCIDFIRTSAVCGSGMTSILFGKVQFREQINQLTSYIDGSMIYGYSDELAKEVRDLDAPLGRLKEGVIFQDRKPLLPYASGQAGMDCRRNLTESDVNCFLAGDIRANEQIGLIAMHTLFMREHNRLAKELHYLNPHWDSDMLYFEARKIVGAAIQHITYTHWLKLIVGARGIAELGEFREYNPQLNPSISNAFATAALRFGHTLINPILARLDWNFTEIRQGNLPLHLAFFSPWRVVDEGGIDPLLRGMFTVAAKKKMPQENLNTELTEKLFLTAHAVALDLAAMNIHRARDHALPGYTAYREFCKMRPIRNFEDLSVEIRDPEVRKKLEILYGDPDNIDIFVGGILEDPLPGARVGPLFSCLLIEQFKRLRDGDRFWYENPAVFKPDQLVQIKQYSLARILCDNGDNITRITKDIFKLPEVQVDGLISCDQIPKVDLKLWSECCSDCRYVGQLNTISRLNARNKRNVDDNNEQLEELKRKIAELERRLDSTMKRFEEL